MLRLESIELLFVMLLLAVAVLVFLNDWNLLLLLFFEGLHFR